MGILEESKQNIDSSSQSFGDLKEIYTRLQDASRALDQGFQQAQDSNDLASATVLVSNLREIANEFKTAVETAPDSVKVELILSGFKKHDDGLIEMTLPLGMSIQRAGQLLNAAAAERGMEYPVFHRGNAEFWAKNEANAALRTEPGRTYQFTIPTDSVYKTRYRQIAEYGNGAPLAAIAIAEACELLNTENKGTLFKFANGITVWVRGSTPGVELNSNAYNGVYVSLYDDGGHQSNVAFARSVPARDPATP